MSRGDLRTVASASPRAASVRGSLLHFIFLQPVAMGRQGPGLSFLGLRCFDGLTSIMAMVF